MKSLTRGRRLFGVSAAVVCLAVSAVRGFEPPTAPLAERVSASDAVVLAVVTNVQYRLSQGDTVQSPIPFTFVTFRVERVLRGQVDSQLTLRFQGGLFPDGRFMDDPTTPLFDIGERSLLLVTRGDQDQPLSGWRYGRLRVVDGRVYDDFGRPLSLNGGARVTFGRTVRLQEVVEHTMGALGRTFNPRLLELPPAVVSDPDAPAVRRGAVATIAEPLESVIAWMRTQPSASAARAIASADPNTSFAAGTRAAVRLR